MFTAVADRLGHRLKATTALVVGGTIVVCAVTGGAALWWERDHIGGIVGQTEAREIWRHEVQIAAWALAVLGLLGVGAAAAVSRQIDARVKAEDALSRSQRLETIGQLTGSVAHDFNNLLTTILGSVSLLQVDPRYREGALAASLRDIEHAGWRAADLTRALLSFMSQEPLRPQTVDLNDHIRAVPQMLQRLTGPDITITVTRASEPLRAHVDPARFETALMNLCVNARDAMPKVGRLAIETRAVTFDAVYAGTLGLAPGPYGLVTVSDTGGGIRPADLSRVREPFFTTKAPGKGTGLGLSMVDDLMAQSRGHMRIESEVGRGTSVMLYFPAVASEAGTGAERDPSPEPVGCGEAILLVEPEESVRRVTAAALGSLGYRVFAAADAPAAVALARAMPPLHLLLTDVDLPRGVAGAELAEQLLDQRRAFKVLYSCGYSAEAIDHRRGAPTDGALLSKPYDRRELARAVRTALDRQEPAA